MRFVKAFGQFWYDFIIGDDWKIAVAVVSGLIVVFLIMHTGALSDSALTVVGGVVLVAAFTVSLLIDVRSKRE
jgi:hypothetical protein